MSTGLAPIPDTKEVEFIPFGERETLKLSINQIRRFICKPTKAGQIATDEEIVQFMMLCKARALNPWVGDAFLVGYDLYKGNELTGASFSLITAVQALLKRAEANEHFNGMEYGVIVVKRDAQAELIYRNGDFYMEDEILLGGWARAYRKDREHPFYDALKLTTFNKKILRWNDDPGGMIVKCAQASVCRTAFPTQTGGLYIREEMENVIDAQPATSENLPAPQTRNLESVADRLRTEQVIPQREREEVPRSNDEKKPAPGRQAPQQQEQEERQDEPPDEPKKEDEAPPPRMPELQSFIDSLSVIDSERGLQELLGREFPVGHERSAEEVKTAQAWMAWHKKHFMVGVGEEANRLAGRIRKIGTEAGLKKLLGEALFDQAAIERREAGF